MELLDVLNFVTSENNNFKTLVPQFFSVCAVFYMDITCVYTLDEFTKNFQRTVYFTLPSLLTC